MILYMMLSKKNLNNIIISKPLFDENLCGIWIALFLEQGFDGAISDAGSSMNFTGRAGDGEVGEGVKQPPLPSASSPSPPELQSPSISAPPPESQTLSMSDAPQASLDTVPYPPPAQIFKVDLCHYFLRFHQKILYAEEEYVCCFRLCYSEDSHASRPTFVL